MILITDPGFIPDEALVINALFDWGLELLHLRKPAWSIKEMEQLLTSVESRFHNRIMIHSHFGLIDRFGIKGLHFPGQMRSSFPLYSAYDCLKSTSVHSIDEMKSLTFSFDYLFLSPLFPSVSKPDYSAQWDFNLLKAGLMSERSYRVIALGGITTENKHRVAELGFDDYALLGSVWEPVKAGASLADLLKIYRSFNNE